MARTVAQQKAHDSFTSARGAHQIASDISKFAYRTLIRVLEEGDKESLSSARNEYVDSKTKEAEAFVAHEIAYYEYLRS